MKHDIHIESCCQLCEFSTLLDGGEHCLCTKKGVVYSYGCCRKFQPDLLKFSPGTRPSKLGTKFEKLKH